VEQGVKEVDGGKSTTEEAGTGKGGVEALYVVGRTRIKGET